MAQFSCFKCGGSGKIGAFAHIEGGECFQCNGSGKLSYQPKPQKPFVEPHPEWVVAVGKRATIKQWEYLDKLCGDADTLANRFLKAAGAPASCEPYVSKAVMSRAIEIAKRDDHAKANRSARRAA